MLASGERIYDDTRLLAVIWCESRFMV